MTNLPSMPVLLAHVFRELWDTASSKDEGLTEESKGGVKDRALFWKFQRCK